MEIFSYAAASFLGMIAALLMVHQTSKLIRVYGPPTSRWIFKQVLLPKLFRGQHKFNLTRIALLCHLLHWTLAIWYNVWKVRDLDHASSRASQMSIIHLVPLLASRDLASVADAFGVSLATVLTVHPSLAVMALVQGGIHVVIHYHIAKEEAKPVVFRTIVCVPNK